ncbi:MAG: hypothetical protein PHQ35_01525 [Phycisphaerae bacterium]|nr:hypothetical protein [Phycisphaerae bacterium]MDD5381695.1 hypothetical protein [Phycisphaerae bacterium]
MNDLHSNFIQANKEQWSRIPASKGSNGVLLVEMHHHPIISHANAVVARIIKEAKEMSIRWLDNSYKPEVQQRLMSYDSTSQIIYPAKLSLFDKSTIGFKFVYHALKILLTQNIKGFYLDGVPFGDILYDSYLVWFKVATIHRVNRGVLKTLLALITSYYRFKKTLQSCHTSAVLVSHQVGLSSGVLMRTALKLGLKVYLRSAGNNKLAINLYTSLSQIYQYSYTPRPVDVRLLASLSQQKMDEEFKDLAANRTRGLGDEDVSRAYGEGKKVYNSKAEFAQEFGLSKDKPVVFVMLHAFNDHPHTHFGKMLFKDYYDWFVKTLDFAKGKTDVNWVFKEHPTAALYPANDISMPSHFVGCPNHIVFLDRESPFNSRSLLNFAHAVITVLGTAGMELPALGAIPSILAGVTYYSGFGFSIEPETQDEYFKTLSNIEKIGKLSKVQQDTARRVFLYIERYSYVPFAWSPLCSLEETKDPDLDKYYWRRVIDCYGENAEVLVSEFQRYVEYISKKDFSRLAGLQFLGQEYYTSAKQEGL